MAGGGVDVSQRTGLAKRSGLATVGPRSPVTFTKKLNAVQYLPHSPAPFCAAAGECLQIHFKEVTFSRRMWLG